MCVVDVDKIGRYEEIPYRKSDMVIYFEKHGYKCGKCGYRHTIKNSQRYYRHMKWAIVPKVFQSHMLGSY